MMIHIWKTWLSIIFASKYFPSKSVDVCSVFSEHLELEKTLTSVFLLVPCFFVWLLAIQLFLDVPGWACKGYFGLDIKRGGILRWPLASLCLVVLLALWHVFVIGLFKALYFALHFCSLFLPSPSHTHPHTRDNYLMCWMCLFLKCVFVKCVLLFGMHVFWIFINGVACSRMILGDAFFGTWIRSGVERWVMCTLALTNCSLDGCPSLHTLAVQKATAPEPQRHLALSTSQTLAVPEMSRCFVSF